MAEDAKVLHERINAAIDQLDEVKKTRPGEVVTEIEPRTVSVIETGLRASLAVAESAIGECQKAVPFSPLHPVLKPDGDDVVWCCNHNPPHCTG